ncbi:hypothetical protein ACRAWD_31770 [Caulobacter segnis]
MVLTPLQAVAAERGLDTALINARVWTPGVGAPRLSAVGVVGERIAAVGAERVRSLTTAKTRIVDLKGAFLMPAFTDNHTHFLDRLDRSHPGRPAQRQGPRADFAARSGRGGQGPAG